MRLESAHHDTARAADPDRLRPDRGGPHLGFGAAPARLELTVALGELARRLPGLRPATAVEDVPWSRGEVDHGPLALTVSW